MVRPWGGEGSVLLPFSLFNNVALTLNDVCRLAKGGADEGDQTISMSTTESKM